MRPSDRGTPQATVGRAKTRRAWLAALATLLPLALALAGCGTQAGDWRLLGPSSGHVYSIATDPHIPSLVYAGADDGFIYRARADQTGRVDPGAGLPADTVTASLLPDPKVPGRVFAGTTHGLYLSQRYGDRWSPFGSGLPPNSTPLALAGTPDDSWLLAGLDHHGIFRSADDGATWRIVSTGLPASSTPVALLWDASARRWWAGLQGATGVELFSSVDNGQAWAPASGDFPTGADVNALARLTRAGGAGTLFAATAVGLYDSADSGATWARSRSGLPAGAALAVVTASGQSGALYASVGSGVYISTDTGATWTVVARGLTASAQGLAVATDGRGSRVVFAAAGELARYPSGITTSDSTSFFLLVAMAIALVIGGYILSRRNRRFGYAMGANENERTIGRAAQASRAWTRQSTVQAPRAAQRGGAPQALAPADLTTREQTGAPARPDKIAQNGHGVPDQHE